MFNAQVEIMNSDSLHSRACGVSPTKNEWNEYSLEVNWFCIRSSWITFLVVEALDPCWLLIIHPNVIYRLWCVCYCYNIPILYLYANKHSIAEKNNNHIDDPCNSCALLKLLIDFIFQANVTTYANVWDLCTFSFSKLKTKNRFFGKTNGTKVLPNN